MCRKDRETMSTADYCLGIDLGTTSVKVCVLDADTQASVFSTLEPTNADIKGLEGGRDEQNIKFIIECVQTCLNRLNHELKALVRCIAVSGQTHGVVLWRSGGQDKLDCSNLYTWQDQRANADFIASLPKPDSHQHLAPGFGCVTLFWLARNEPEKFAEEGYDCAGGVMDYLVAALCGLDRPVTGEQIAASWGYYNTETHAWNIEILTEAGFPVQLLPMVTTTGSKVGSLQSDWCGIPAGTPVLTGLGDLQCATLSALTSETDAVINIGTSSQLCFPIRCSTRSDSPSAVSYVPFFDQQYLSVAASLNGGNVLTHFVKMLTEWFAAFDIQLTEDVIWNRLKSASSASNIPESSSLKILPTVFGERHLSEACVTLTGSSESYLNFDCVYRSLCCGIVDNLNMMIPCTMLVESGIKRLVLSGSVFDKNPCVREHVQKVYGQSLEITSGQGTDSATGAAIVAAKFLRKTQSK